MMTSQPDDILRAAAEAGVEFVSLQFTDIVGGMKHVTIPVGELPDCLDHGVWFDGSAIEAFARIAEHDMYLVPDPGTFALIPWDEGTGYSTARLICDVYSPDGRPFVGDPRFALRRAIDEYVVAGIRTTLPFFRQVMADSEFIAGTIDTDYISRLAGRLPASEPMRLGPGRAPSSERRVHGGLDAALLGATSDDHHAAFRLEMVEHLEDELHGDWGRGVRDHAR